MGVDTVILSGKQYNCLELIIYFFLYLEDNQIAELEGKSEETFSEGLAELAKRQEVTRRMKETEMWSKYIAWCEERYGDKNVSETLREKVSGEYLLFLIPLPATPSSDISLYSIIIQYL